MQTKIIINADDFGINVQVTNAIIDSIDKGYVTSTTIMSNGSCLQQALEYSKLHPTISYGIHFCLSEFDSLTKSEVLYKYGITDISGRFIKNAIFNVKEINHELSQALKDELQAQYDRLYSMGFSISHADSHHHVHTMPQLHSIFLELLKKNHIKKVRIPVRMRLLSAIRHPFVYIQNRNVTNSYKKNFITASYFSSCRFYLQNPVNCNVIELMCHPGHSGQQYKNEMIMLMNDNHKNILKQNMISYNEI